MLTARKWNIAGLFLVSAFVVFFMVPGLAEAASPWSTGAKGLKDEVVIVTQVLAGVGIIAVGLLCLFGKINKGWLVACLVGVVLVFGAEQVVSWVRTIAGV